MENSQEFTRQRRERRHLRLKVKAKRDRHWGAGRAETRRDSLKMVLTAGTGPEQMGGPRGWVGHRFSCYKTHSAVVRRMVAGGRLGHGDT